MLRRFSGLMKVLDEIAHGRQSLVADRRGFVDAVARLAKGDGADASDPDSPSLIMAGQFGGWRRDLTLRHAEMLCALAFSPQGRSGPQLAGILAAQPYRFAGSIELNVRYPADRRMLLPPSSAPAIRTARMAGVAPTSVGNND